MSILNVQQFYQRTTCRGRFIVVDLLRLVLDCTFLSKLFLVVCSTGFVGPNLVAPYLLKSTIQGVFAFGWWEAECVRQISPAIHIWQYIGGFQPSSLFNFIMQPFLAPDAFTEHIVFMFEILLWMYPPYQMRITCLCKMCFRFWYP